jgi:hypothetical protein
MESEVVNGFWMGSELQEAQRLSIRSFIANGHSYRLWAYQDLDVPAGACLADANQIVPYEVVERWLCYPSQHLYQTFANYFRYELIHAVGGWWMDLDSICLRPLDFITPYVFCGIDGVSQRPQLGDLPCHVINGAFRAPSGAPFLQTILNRIRADAQRGHYPDFGIWGTVVFTRAIFDHGLECYRRPENVFIPFGFQDARRIFMDPTLVIPEWAYAVHLYNFLDPDYDTPVDGSVWERLLTTYGETDLPRVVSNRHAHTG